MSKVFVHSSKFVHSSNRDEALESFTPEQHANRFREVSRMFVEEVKHIHGPDKADEVIRALKNILGSDVSNVIVYDLLNQHEDRPVGYVRSLSFTFDMEYILREGIYKPTFNRKIELIKLMRMVTRIGLNDAKNAVEDFYTECFQHYSMQLTGEPPIMKFLVHDPYVYDEVHDALSDFPEVKIL